MRRSLGAEYDRLTTCEPAGYPRWLLEPYVREFVNTPSQSWWLNDLGNDTRRIYINQEHKNIDGTHSPEGDSVGFWVDDMLIVHTIHIYPERLLPRPAADEQSVRERRGVAHGPAGQRRARGSASTSRSTTSSRWRGRVTATYTFRRNTELESRRLPHAPLGVREQRELVPGDRRQGQARDAVPSAGRARVRRRARRRSAAEPGLAARSAGAGEESDLRRSA